MSRRSGFTLVELMIVVAIIGVLAAIAIPNFQEMQLRSKRSEPWMVNRGIQTAEIAYNSMFDRWVDTSTNPGSPITKEAKPWKDGEAGWSDLDFEPDGEVRCTYYTDIQKAGYELRVTGECDIDDDNSSAFVRLYTNDAGSSYWTDNFPLRY